MRNKGMGDFGSTNDNMGDVWSNFKDSIEDTVQDWGTSIEESARNVVKSNTSWLPPELHAEAERLIAEAGGKMGEDLKQQLMNKANDLIKQQAHSVLNDPANQNTAIEAGTLAVAKKFSGFLISIKDSILNGTIHQKHPVFTGFAVGIPSLLFIKFMIGKKRTQVVYSNAPKKSAPKKTAKANPRKKRKSKKR